MRRSLGMVVWMVGLAVTVGAQTPGRLPWLATEEGKPIDTRPTEKKDNTPAFPEQTRAPFHATAPFKVTTLINNLEVSWSLAFLPSGNIILTERLPGRMRILHTDGTVSAPLAGVSAVLSPGAKDIGLLDVVLDPDFANNRRIFFSFFNYIDGTNTNTCIARARLDEKGARADRRHRYFPRAAGDAVEASRRKDGRAHRDRAGRQSADDAWRSIGFAAVGRRAEARQPPRQDHPHHAGWRAAARTIRSSAKPGVLPEIWAYGMRSPEGLAFDPRTGRLWQNDHGPRGGDELNIVEKGKNYGWPLVAHGIDYPGAPIGVTRMDGMEEPIYYWDPVIAPSGLAFYTGNLFPQWKNSLFVGGLRGAMLDRLEIVNDKVVAEEPLLTDLGTRIRDVRVGPDGAVYVLTDSGTPSMSPSTPPTSRLLKLTPR